MFKFLRHLGPFFNKISRSGLRTGGNQERAIEDSATVPTPPPRPSPKMTGDSTQTLDNISASNHCDINVATGNIRVQRQHTVNSVINHFHPPVPEPHLLGSTDQEILDWLSKTNFRDYHMRNKAAQVDGTCEDFLCSSSVERWLKRDYKVLVGVGIPGAGKTIAASALVNHIEIKKPSPIGQRFLAMYIFCNPKEDLSVERILASLIRQVLERNREWLDHARELHARCLCELTTPTQGNLVSTLMKICENFGAVYLVVDGLHGVKKEVQVGLLEVLTQTGISLFVTARETDIAPATLHDAERYQIQATQQDIRSFVTKKLQYRCVEGRIFNMDINDIAKAVGRASQGMFLHAELQTQVLQLCKTPDDFRDNLRGFPEKLETKFQVIFGLLNKGHSGTSFTSRAKEVLSWILYAQRSLYVEELQYLLATNPNTYQFDRRRIVSEAALVSACCGLVTLEECMGGRRLVRLVHLTAEPVLRELLEGAAPHAHQTLVSVCIASLKAAGFHIWDKRQPFLDLPGPHPSSTTSPNFLNYAYDNWAFHARVCPKKQVVEEFLLQCVSFPAKGDLLGPLHVAAFYNLLPVERLTLRLDQDARTLAESKTPLMLAAGEGHLDAVLRLLGEDPFLISSPSLAAERNHLNSVNKARHNYLEATDRQGRNALMYASKGGHPHVVECLLQYCNIKLDPADATGKTAITLAQAAGHASVVISLHKADESQRKRQRRCT